MAQRRRSWQTIPPIALYAAELRQAAFFATDIRLFPLHGPNQTIDASVRSGAPLHSHAPMSGMITEDRL